MMPMMMMGRKGTDLLLIACWLGTVLRCYGKLGREEWLGKSEETAPKCQVMAEPKFESSLSNLPHSYFDD